MSPKKVTALVSNSNDSGNVGPKNRQSPNFLLFFLILQYFISKNTYNSIKYRLNSLDRLKNKKRKNNKTSLGGCT